VKRLQPLLLSLKTSNREARDTASQDGMAEHGSFRNRASQLSKSVATGTAKNAIPSVQNGSMFGEFFSGSFSVTLSTNVFRYEDETYPARLSTVTVATRESQFNEMSCSGAIVNKAAWAAFERLEIKRESTLGKIDAILS